ncbi:MAG: antibiotic biosynthesis monooxygenase family protein [Bowdeniella nasicola]|nr:antibiotic biosynthesis monooxygenase family protein [Bowdeniella nasicola]
MSIVVTNEITVDPARAGEVAAKFEANSLALRERDGFLGFDLCRPTDPADDRWLVVTRWRDEQAYANWRESKGFARSHNEDGAKERPSPRAGGAHSVVRHYDVAFSTEH